MKSIFIFTLLFSTAAFAAAKNPLSGSWKGYCFAVDEKEAQLCSFTFGVTNNGTYTCDYYTDLRCGSVGTKKLVLQFDFVTNSKGLTKISFTKGGDLESQTSSFVVTGDLLSETILETKKRIDKVSIKDHVGPYKYTRVK
jgi:hypothetical protein